MRPRAKGRAGSSWPLGAPTLPSSAQRERKNASKPTEGAEGAQPRAGEGRQRNSSHPVFPFSPVLPQEGPPPLLTFLMWSRNSGEDRQSSGLRTGGSCTGRGAAGLAPGQTACMGSPRVSPGGVAPPGSTGPGCPAAEEGAQSLGCELQLTLSLAHTAWPALPLAPLTSSASWKTCVPQAS